MIRGMKNQLRLLGFFASLVFGFAIGHSALAVPLFSECKPATESFRYTCLAIEDCINTTSPSDEECAADPSGCNGVNPTGQGIEYQGCGFDNPTAVCCRILKPKPPAPGDACGSAGGSCKPFCTPNFETQNSGITCSAGNVCCMQAATTHSNDCSLQGGECKLGGCGTGGEDVGQLGCLDGYMCCKSSALVTSSSTGAGSGGTGSTSEPIQANSPDRLVLPSCTKDGSCTLDDVVQTGINFATFIMGLSGALFFAVFIYGGAMYLASFGNKSRVETGKKAIRGAVIGMVFVLGAWTIVNTLVQGLRYGKSPSDASTLPTASQLKPEEKCPATGAGYSCVTLNGNTSQEAMADGQSKGYSCLTGKCPGAVNILCCKQ